MASPDDPHGAGRETRRPDPIAHGYKPALGKTEHAIATTAFHLIERGFLIVVVLLTLGGAASELIGIFRTQTVTLADILLMFLYTEVIGMISVFYSGRNATFVYPIFIAITALARLIVLQSKDMAPENIVFEASAILLLAIASIVIVRASKR